MHGRVWDPCPWDICLRIVGLRILEQIRALVESSIITSGVATSWVVDRMVMWCCYLGLSGEGACARGREAHGPSRRVAQEG